MDCMQACEVLSAAHDGELVDAALLAGARVHAAECSECRAFVRVLARMASAPAPKAPPELVDRLVALGIDEARATAAEATGGSNDTPVSVGPQERTALRKPRLTMLLPAAAVLLVAMAAGTIALVGGQPTREVASETPISGMPEAADELGAAPQESAQDATTMRAAATPPPYVAFNGTAWALADDPPPEPSQLTTAGVVESSLAEGGTPSEHYAYFATTGGGSTLYVRATTGEYLAFEQVVRTLGRARFALASENPIRAFGAWPVLPARFAAPTAPDGSPTFGPSGFDDLGRDVFVPPTGRTRDGFAIAPDADPADPAAGNPGWTWWVPLE